MNLRLHSAAALLPRLRLLPRSILPLLRSLLADAARRAGVFLREHLEYVELDGSFCGYCRDVHAKGSACLRPRVLGFCHECAAIRVLTKRGLCALGHADITGRRFFIPKLTRRALHLAPPRRFPETVGEASGQVVSMR